MDAYSKLRITFLAGTLGHGGAERQLFYMIQALCQRRIVPRVLSLDQHQFWEEPIRSLGSSIVWVGRRRSRIARLVAMLADLWRHPPDILQSQHFFTNAYATVAALPIGTKAIGAMRNEGEAELRRAGPFGGRLNLHWPPILAANTRLAIRQAVSRGIPPSRLFFLPNVVDTAQFRPAPRSGDRPVTFLAVGRLARQKRFDRFITALAKLRDTTDLVFRGWIVGPAPSDRVRIELENQAVRLGLVPGCLRFFGGSSEIGRLYDQGDVCVLTSDYEGTPNVALEAMASGLPVVSTKVGGVQDIISHGDTGLLVDREDSQGLVQALKQLARSPVQRLEMGGRAREYVEKNHGIDRLPGYLDSLYRMAIPQPAWRPGVVEGRSI